MSPIMQNIEDEFVDNLNPIPGTLCLFRVSYPWKDEHSHLKEIDPKLNQGQYIIPSAHAHTCLKPGVMNPLYDPSNNGQGRQSQWNQKPPPIPAQMPPSYDQASNRNRDRVQDMRMQPRTQTPVSGVGSDRTRPDTPNDIMKAAKGIKIVLHGVHNYKPADRCKIGIALMDDKFVLRDDKEVNTRRNTIVHCANPEAIEDTLNQTNKIIEDRQRGNNVMFEQEFSYELNVPRYVWDNKVDAYLVFQVLEISQSPIHGDDSKIMGSDYQLRGWFIHKINNARGQVASGTFMENLYGGNCPNPGDGARGKKVLGQKIEFTVENMANESMMMNSRKKA